MPLEMTEIDGEKALIIRRGDETFTIGATCTHYGGPLDQGLIVGDTIRCPWHHACFDLRTGEALRAPALAPIKVYGGGQAILPARGQTGVSILHAIAIVGAGAAGTAAADMLRRRGFAGTIAMFGTEAPVDRPNLSKDYLAGHAPEEWLPLPLPNDVDLQVGRRVTALDAKTKTLTLDDGSTRAFDAILLATGADSVRLPIAGADRPHVQYLRTLADSRAIIAKAEKGRRACIIGAGFIGLEVAASLREREVDVTVVAPEDIPLARIMGDDVGRFVQRLHEQHGVRFRLGTGVKSIESDAVITAAGERIPADFVIIGGGVRPNTQLAEGAGIKVDNGIVVNEFFETSAPGIFAAGDAARWPDKFSGRAIRVEHWVVAERHGQAAACAILGDGQAFNSAPFFWSAHYDMTINYIGNAAGWDRAEVRGSLDARRALVVYRTADRIAAIATIGMDRECLEAEVAMEKNDQDALEALVRSL